MAVCKVLILTLRLLLIITCCFATTETADPLNGRKVLLVSMDGFRHDYFQKAETPFFDTMIASGVKVPYVNTTFSTFTFPCHTSIVTGLNAESHGIIGNNFYDPMYNDTFPNDSSDPKWWNASEPIWINAVKAGLKVGTFFWPGSDVEYGGVQPTSFRNYSTFGKLSFEEKIRTVVASLSRDNYDFAVGYFDQPDHAGHKYGPEDPHTVSAIQDMDDVLGMLMLKLENSNIKDKTDVIITSDHGMATVDMVNKTIDIKEYVDEKLLELVIPDSGPYLNILPKPNKSQEIVDALKDVPHIHAFLKEDIPEHLHYRKNRRILPVLVLADEGWLFVRDKKEAAKGTMKGTHGYDNALMSMKTIFVASGPSFKKGYRLSGPIKSVDIYPLLCHLLKITPAPNNGSLERVKPLLDGGATEFVPSTILCMISLVLIWVI